MRRFLRTMFYMHGDDDGNDGDDGVMVMVMVFCDLFWVPLYSFVCVCDSFLLPSSFFLLLLPSSSFLPSSSSSFLLLPSFLLPRCFCGSVFRMCRTKYSHDGKSSSPTPPGEEGGGKRWDPEEAAAGEAAGGRADQGRGAAGRGVRRPRRTRRRGGGMWRR